MVPVQYGSRERAEKVLEYRYSRNSTGGFKMTSFLSIIFKLFFRGGGSFGLLIFKEYFDKSKNKAQRNDIW